MTLVLNKVPTFGEEFGRAVGEGAGQGISSGLDNRQKLAQMRQENEAIKTNFGIDLSGIVDPNERKSILVDALKGRQEQDLMKSRLSQEHQNEMELQRNKYGFEEQLQSKKPESAASVKSKKEEEVSKQIKGTAQKAFNGMVKLLKSGNVGQGSGIMGGLFGGQTAQDVGEFQSLGGGIEAMLVDMVSRGTLSDSRFKYITEKLLPQPNDRDKVIEGKLKGLAQILDLDISELTNNKKTSKENVGTKERPPLTSFHR
jgi:hypothetical protein